MPEQDRVPKAYRYRLHRLKNAYRKAYRSEPSFERPVTDEAALQAIAFLEEALQRIGVQVENRKDADTRGGEEGRHHEGIRRSPFKPGSK